MLYYIQKHDMIFIALVYNIIGGGLFMFNPNSGHAHPIPYSALVRKVKL